MVTRLSEDMYFHCGTFPKNVNICLSFLHLQEQRGLHGPHKLIPGNIKDGCSPEALFQIRTHTNLQAEASCFFSLPLLLLPNYLKTNMSSLPFIYYYAIITMCMIVIVSYSFIGRLASLRSILYPSTCPSTPHPLLYRTSCCICLHSGRALSNFWSFSSLDLLTASDLLNPLCNSIIGEYIKAFLSVSQVWAPHTKRRWMDSSLWTLASQKRWDRRDGSIFEVWMHYFCVWTVCYRCFTVLLSSIGFIWGGINMYLNQKWSLKVFSWRCRFLWACGRLQRCFMTVKHTSKEKSMF